MSRVCRLLWVLAFAMGPYACMERTWKPFNPILGETFEVELDQGVKFFAEQVRKACVASLRSCLRLAGSVHARARTHSHARTHSASADFRCHITRQSAWVTAKTNIGRTTSCRHLRPSSWATAWRYTPSVRLPMQCNSLLCTGSYCCVCTISCKAVRISNLRCKCPFDSEHPQSTLRLH